MIGGIKSLAGGPIFDSSVGGTFAAIRNFWHTDRVVAWTSRPAVKKIYWVSLDSGIVISSDPLLCASFRAWESRKSIELNCEYLRDYLAFGYSLTGSTPYRSVEVLGPEEALVISRNCITTVRKSYYNKPDMANKDELSKSGALRDSLVQVISAGVTDEKPLLRLSGGKDSRSLLAGLVGANVDATTQTRSAHADTEHEIAKRLAGAVGYDFVRTVPQLAVSGDVRMSVVQTLGRTRGLGLAEAHQTMYEGASPIVKGQALLMGHSHIQRGGFAHKMKNTLEESTRILRNQVAAETSNDLLEGSRAYIDNWIKDAWTDNPLELQYEFHVQHRAGSYVSGHYNDYSSEATLLYPMLDQSFVSLCDQLNMFDKVSERLVFLMIRSLSEELLRIPLKDGQWRFEADGPKDISGLFYADRALTEVKVEDSYRTPDAYFSLNGPSLTWACLNLRAEPGYSFVRSFLSSELCDLIESDDPDRLIRSVSSQSGSRNFDNFRKMIWRTYAATIWLTGEWLPADK